MSFSDKDLTVLREHFVIDKEFHANAMWIDRDKFECLLARLDAAEVIVHRNNIEHNPLRHDYEKDEARCEACQEYKAWRKSAGKPQGEGKSE